MYYENNNGDTKCIQDDIPYDIPRSWTWARLGTICEVRNGSTPRRDNPDFWKNGSIPWFTIDDKHDQGLFIYSTKQHIAEGAMSLERIVPAESVLLCCTASVGEVAFTKIPLTTNQQFNGLTIRKHYSSLINPYYLLLFALTLKKLLKNKYATATTFGFVSVSKVESFLIPIPPYQEQERIYALFDSIDKIVQKIDGEKNKINKLCLVLKEKILDNIFSDSGSYKSYYEIRCGELHDFCESITKGSTPTTYGYSFQKEGINFIKVENISDGKILDNICCHISKEAHDFQKRSQLKENDILYSIAGTIGKTCIVTENVLPANTNQAFAIISGFSSDILPEYLFYYLLWVAGKDGLESHGGGMNNATLTGLKKLSIWFPSNEDEQQLIVDKIKESFEYLNIIRN